MNSSPWRLEEVDSGDEQYLVVSYFAVCHTPPDQKHLVSTVGAQTQVRFLHFVVSQTLPDEQDPFSTVHSQTQGRFLRFAVCQTLFRLFRPSQLAPIEHDPF